MRRVDWAILGLALVLRLAWLDLKPAHFDEGVNGWFVDRITREGAYHYDPSNFHGPLHFYVLFVAQQLFGRELWALRLPIALVSTLCVAAMLAYRSYLPRRACRLAALALAISPAAVFYGRYAIHESWLLLFLLTAVWGLAGLWREGRRRHLWATTLGVAGLILTKETYVIHGLALALTVPTLLLIERITPSAPFPFAGRRWSECDLRRAVIAATVLVIFFYTGALLDWSSLPGLWQTFALWARTGTGGISGHEKPWFYFLHLIAHYEWPALVGLTACVGLLRPQANRLARGLAIYGAGTLVAYSLIAYKTPWCVLVLLWPFHLVFGLALHRLMSTVDRWTIGVSAGAVLVCSLAATLLLNFRNYTREEEPYVYVQTQPDIELLLAPLRKMSASDSRNFHLHGVMLLEEQHPMTWQLGDFTKLEMLLPGAEPESWDAAFLLVDESEIERTERELDERYFKQMVRIRGQSNTSAALYFAEDPFAHCFPGRTPEFP